MSDNDFPEAPKLPILTLVDIIRKYPRELWVAEPNDEGYVKQAPDWILTEAVEALSHIDSTEDRNEFVYESLAISGDWGDFDGDGHVDCVTGGMYTFKPFGQISRILLWRNRTATAVD